MLNLIIYIVLNYLLYILVNIFCKHLRCDVIRYKYRNQNLIVYIILYSIPMKYNTIIVSFLQMNR